MTALIQHGSDVRLDAVPTAPVYELVIFRPSTADPGASYWATGAGEARCSGSNHDSGSHRRIVGALRIATDRWLILNPQAEWVARSAAPPAPSGGLAATRTVTDVTGKWRELRLTGSRATRLLANSVDVEALLADRDCARTTLFDCPAILCKVNEGYSILIERSYEHFFVVAVEQAIQARAAAR